MNISIFSPTPESVEHRELGLRLQRALFDLGCSPGVVMPLRDRSGVTMDFRPVVVPEEVVERLEALAHEV